MNAELLTMNAVCDNAFVLSKSLTLKVSAHFEKPKISVDSQILLGFKCVLCICGMIATVAVLRRAVSHDDFVSSFLVLFHLLE